MNFHIMIMVLIKNYIGCILDLKLNRHQEAIYMYDQVIKLNPQNE